jgi:hypothetical protein
MHKQSYITLINDEVLLRMKDLSKFTSTDIKMKVLEWKGKDRELENIWMTTPSHSRQHFEML